jgi:hypothetical protein
VKPLWIPKHAQSCKVMRTASLNAYKDPVNALIPRQPRLLTLTAAIYIYDEAEWLLSVLTLQKFSSLGVESDLQLIRGHLCTRKTDK